MKNEPVIISWKILHYQRWRPNLRFHRRQKLPGRGGVILPALCILRVVFLPLFAFCNAQPRSATVFFHEDYFPIVFMALFAISNGYLGSLCMMYGPSLVEPKHAETAGTMMAFMLILGLAAGAGFSFVMAELIHM